MEPIDWLVDKILPVGLSILGAPSKYYKSYMALGLCVAICQGAKFLGFDCTKHDCLYFDLGCFTVQFSVTKGWGVIKTYYVPEEDDIQNVLQTVFENY